MDVLLKQRLVGAIVLVALGVIFVPMILEGPNRTLVPEMEALPEPEDPMISAPLEAFPAPDAIPAEPDVSVVQTDTQVVEAPESPVEAVQPDDGPGTESESRSKPEPEVEPVPEPEPVAAAPGPESKPVKPAPLGSWVVQMGSFSTEKNALRLRDRLRKSGFVTQVEKATVDGKPRFRVRVGPFLERADAEQSRQQMQDRLSLKGRVLSYP
ncbi:MAG: SPOR domain-containing protein [Thiogranum sp.]